MSDQSPLPIAPPDTQQQRWVKYGSNVAVTVALTVAIVAVVLVLAQRFDHRFDTTSAGEFSLKPQTLNVIRNLKEPVKLVSLYTKSTAAARQDEQADFTGAVADLLAEYHSQGRDIDVEFIDPQAQPAKAADLLAEVTGKYGGEVAKYKAFLEGRKQAFADFKAFAKAELAKLPAFDAMAQDGMDAKVGLVSNTLANVSTDADAAERQIAKSLAAKVPDYKVAAAGYDAEARGVSDDVGGIGDFLKQVQTVADPAITPALKKYAADAGPRYAAVKVKSDAVDADFKKLGELKLDDVKQKVGESNAILVLGPTDMRSLSFEQVWQPDTDRKQYAAATAGQEVKIKPKFIGEQQVTGAILAVTAAKKPRVAFVRPGGAPLTSPGFPPFQQGGPFSQFADRLRMYNFEVVEKDASGQYAVESQMQGQSAGPEPTESEIQDAVWVVIDVPNQQRQQQMPGMPPPASPIDPMLARHLAAGGSAVVLTMTGGDKLAAALGPWGIDVRTDLMAVHDPVKGEGTSADQIDQARRQPAVWVVDKYGPSAIAKPVQSLDAIFVQTAPVVTRPRAGYADVPLLPLPDTQSAWGTHDVEGAGKGEVPTAYSKDAGDLPSPLFAGTTVENDKAKNRVVVAPLLMALNNIMSIRDAELQQRGIRAARFPGNAELLCNSVFWAGHMDQLIAISPGAMDVSRIGTMSDGTLRFWRVGLLLIGLPGLVVLAGVGVYLARRS